MAWKTVQVRTRPNNTTLFETMTDESIAYIQTNYVDTGKRTSFNVTSDDDDELVYTWTSVYENKAARDEFANDSTISTESARRNQVNADNGITKEVTFSGEV
jgi:uncharacterized protein YbaA (DUF1428 family)